LTGQGGLYDMLEEEGYATFYSHFDGTAHHLPWDGLMWRGHLGRGGYAKVFDVAFKGLEKLCPAGAQWAVKVSTRPSAGTGGKPQYLTRALKAACLEHRLRKLWNETPPVLGVVDVRTLGGRVFTLMPRAQMHMLDWVRLIDGNEAYSAPLVLTAKLDLFHQVLVGIERLHAAGVVHCDVKPRNVMIHFDANSLWMPAAFLIDFDFAEPVGNAKWKLQGTHEYMSLAYFESFRCGKDTDIWAAGVMLYELLFAARPYSLPPWDEDDDENVTSALAAFAGRIATGGPELRAELPLGPGARHSLDDMPPDFLGFLGAFFAADAETRFGAIVASAKKLAGRAREAGPLPQGGTPAGGAPWELTMECARGVQNLTGGRSQSAGVFRGTVRQCLTDKLRLDT